MPPAGSTKRKCYSLPLCCLMPSAPRNQTEIKLRQNCFKTVWNCFCFSQNKKLRPWNVLAVLANHSRQPPADGEGDDPSRCCVGAQSTERVCAWRLCLNGRNKMAKWRDSTIEGLTTNVFCAYVWQLLLQHLPQRTRCRKNTSSSSMFVHKSLIDIMIDSSFVWTADTVCDWLKQLKRGRFSVLFRLFCLSFISVSIRRADGIMSNVCRKRSSKPPNIEEVPVFHYRFSPPP